MLNRPPLDLHLLGAPQSGPAEQAAGRSITRADTVPLKCSFETVFAELGRLDRMYPEMDGSFVWTGEIERVPWQIDGMMYDRDDVVQWCEIKGVCPLKQWHQLLRCFGWPSQSLVAHLVQEQLFVGLDELARRWG